MSGPEHAPGGLEVPPGRGGIEDRAVAFACELVARAGVAEGLEQRLRRRTGRPRQIPVRALLVGLVLLGMEDRPLLLTELTEVLFRRLGADARARLGVRGEAPTRRSFRARYRQVRYLFHAVCGSIHPVREADGDRNRGPLEAFCGALLEASFSVMRPDEREAWSGSVGLDATPVPLYSKGPSKTTGRSASDPCGGWYVREGDRREEGPGPSRIAWALEGTIATMAPEDPDAEPRHPNLAVGLALGRPGVDPGGTGARVLAGVIARGHPPGMLGADRAYTAASPGVFHLPARALGYRPVMDYRVDHLGIQANSGGAVLVEGAWCCPASPVRSSRLPPSAAPGASTRAGTTNWSPHGRTTSCAASRGPTATATNGGPVRPRAGGPG